MKQKKQQKTLTLSQQLDTTKPSLQKLKVIN